MLPNGLSTCVTSRLRRSGAGRGERRRSLGTLTLSLTRDGDCVLSLLAAGAAASGVRAAAAGYDGRYAVPRGLWIRYRPSPRSERVVTAENSDSSAARPLGHSPGVVRGTRQRHSSEAGCLFEVGRMGTGMPRVCVRVRVPMGVRGAAARAVGAGMRMHPSCTHGREIMYHGRETSCRWGRGCA